MLALPHTQSQAPTLLGESNVRDAREIELGVAAFARLANGGLVVSASPGTVTHRDLIVALADRYKLPAVYWELSAVTHGGLVSYGT